MSLEQDIKKEIGKINKNVIFQAIALYLKKIFESKNCVGNDYYITSHNILAIKILQKIDLVEKKFQAP